MNNRYWLSPSGEILTVQGQSHVDEIIREPAKFGFTKEEVLEAYKKYDERLGIEGKAREELMKAAMSRGWIRMRDGRDGLYMETGNLKKYKELVYDAINTLLEKGLLHRYDPVTLIDWRTDDMLYAENASEMIKKVYASRKKKGLQLRKLNIV